MRHARILAPGAQMRRLETEAGIRVLRVPSISATGFRFHCLRPPFTDRRVRQAVSYAIDRRAIVDALYPGFSTPSVGPLSQVIRGSADLGMIPRDLERARRLLADAGYPDGFAAAITTTGRNALGVQLAEAAADQLADVGIDASITVVDYATLVCEYRGIGPVENPMEMFIMGNGTSTAEADWGLRPLYLTHPTNENNYGYYSNAEFDRVILAAMRETDETRRHALYRRAQEIVSLEDPAAVWIIDNTFAVTTRAALTNATLLPLGLVTFERAVIGR